MASNGSHLPLAPLAERELSPQVANGFPRGRGQWLAAAAAAATAATQVKYRAPYLVYPLFHTKFD
jgi:hypothetical protein